MTSPPQQLPLVFDPPKGRAKPPRHLADLDDSGKRLGGGHLMGLGEAVATAMRTTPLAHPGTSLLVRATELGVPVTVLRSSGSTQVAMR